MTMGNDNSMSNIGHLNGDFGDVGDAVASLAIIGVVANALPPIAAALTILWLIIRMYEWVRYRVFGLRDRQGEVFK